MNALLYLVLHKAKNRIKEIFRRPGELIVLLFGIALVAFVIYTGKFSDAEHAAGILRDRGELYALILAVYTLVFVLTAKNGFVNGASMFTMADVNLLFNAPFKEKTMLSYGLISQMGRSLMIGVVLIYQYSWMHNIYGVSIEQLLLIVLGYAMTVFLGQMLAMLLYSFTSGSDSKLRIAKIVFYTIIGAFLAYFAFQIMQTQGEILPRVVRAANAFAMHFLPVAGFLRFGVVCAFEGRWLLTLIPVGCFIGCILIYYALVSLLRMDFYEDVLKATEVSFSAITARKEGKAQELAPRNVKVGKTGIGRGSGACVIAQKHRVENRRGKVLLIDLLSLIFAGATVAFAFFFKEPIPALMFSIYMMIISVGTGRWAKELTMPYVYLIPEKPFIKLLYTIREQVPALAAQSVLNFVFLPFLIHCDVLTAIGMMAARFGFGFVFIGVNLLLDRLFGSSGNKALMVIVYYIFCIFASLPAAAFGFAIYQFAMLQLGVVLLLVCVFALLEALLLIFLCRNILQTAEFNNR